jgi:hypothetical protein
MDIAIEMLSTNLGVTLHPMPLMFDLGLQIDGAFPDKCHDTIE